MSQFEISKSRLQENYRTLKGQSKVADCSAVVKADGYGLGVHEVSSAFAEAGCKQFFVAHVTEGVELRKTLKNKIYILHGVKSAEDAAECEQHNLIPVLNNKYQLQFWKKDKPAAVHFDTGMTRLGFDFSDAELLKDYTINLVMSHLIISEEPAHILNKRQLLEFENVAKLFPKAIKSLVNSSGVFLGNNYHFDLLRPGIGLYGGNPVTGRNPMKNVVSLKCPILQIHHIKTEKNVGYSATYIARKGDIIATIECGYADILFRSLSNKGRTYINGRLAPMVGRVSMDLITVKINNIPEEFQKVGQMVEILGDNYTISDMAEDAGTIEYEILTKLGHRYKRVFV